MHGGVVGDAVEPEHLIEAEAKQNLQGRLLGAAFGPARDEPVERSLPADYAIDEFLTQAAIRGGEGWQAGFEEIFDVISRLVPLLQNARGNFSWTLNRHCLIIPLV